MLYSAITILLRFSFIHLFLYLFLSFVYISADEYLALFIADVDVGIVSHDGLVGPAVWFWWLSLDGCLPHIYR